VAATLFRVVRVMVAGPPQFESVMLAAVASAAFSAVSVQLAAVPVADHR
jgi:hypothetical protein